MSILLARVRLRGIYAIVSGATIVVIIPFFQGTILAETGYLDAVNHIAEQHDFGPYLAWVGQNPDTDVIFHALQFLAFLAILPLPAILTTLLWSSPSRAGWLARMTGQVGYGAYALAVLLGLFVSGKYAAAYAHAGSAGARASVAASFGSLFAVQNILSHIIGGILVAVSLMLVGAQMMLSSQKVLPGWLGYFVVLVAALLVIGALQFAAEPAAAETSLSSLGFFALALWLVAVGIYLARLPALPAADAPVHTRAPAGEPGAAAVSDSTPSETGEAIPNAGAGSTESGRQSDDQSRLEETTRQMN